MRSPVLAANWKMFKTTQETLAYVRELGVLLKSIEESAAEVVVAPPFTSLVTAAEAARNTSMAIAAQDMYFETEGAFTGEVSAAMIKDTGATHVIVGHSERRRLFGDTDDWVRRKVSTALSAGLVPIACIGETLGEREQGQTFDVLDRQLHAAFNGRPAAEIAGLIIAYEPVWAIGTGRNATVAEADEAHRYIRARLAEWFGPDAAAACRVLYGGSVKPENARELVALPDVDGCLVGGASLDVGTFYRIITTTVG
jgi:triosephosphate isomerase